MLRAKTDWGLEWSWDHCRPFCLEHVRPSDGRPMLKGNTKVDPFVKRLGFFMLDPLGLCSLCLLCSRCFVPSFLRQMSKKPKRFMQKPLLERSYVEKCCRNHGNRYSELPKAITWFDGEVESCFFSQPYPCMHCFTGR